MTGLKGFKGDGRRRIPRKASRLLQSVAAQFLPEPGIIEHSSHLVRNCLGTGRIKKGVGTADDFRDAAGSSPDDRRTAGHCFQGRQAESFMKRRKDKQAAGVIQADQALVINIAGQPQLMFVESLLSSKPGQAYAVNLLDTADNRQLVPLP